MALSEPVTLKATETGENERLDYAVSAMQGYRVNMEDAHAIVLNLDAATGTSFFGVYDGHGGPAVSKYCAKHLHIELRRHENFRNNLQTAIERTFLRMDEMMKDRRAGRELSGYGGNDHWKAYRKATCMSRFVPFCQKPDYEGPQTDGCTACVVLIRGNQIIVGNAGDSRCVLSRNDEAIELSTDFKPSLPAERQRIEAAGHEVTFSERGNVHRIDDGVAISRSLGDLWYKDNDGLGPQEQAITAFPEVRTAEITQDDQFLIIACDVIWDCLSSQQAVDFIRMYLNAGVEMPLICEALLGHCLSRPRGRENMTVILVRFKTPGTCQVRAPNILPPLFNHAAADKAPDQVPQVDHEIAANDQVFQMDHLCDNLIGEILIRLPADDPTPLVQAALVCKQWRNIISASHFRRRFRDLHPEVPILGLLCNARNTDRGVCKYISTTSFVPERVGFNGWRAIDSHHGIVLLYPLHSKFALKIWKPTTAMEMQIPQLERNPQSWSAALICDKRCACYCSNGPFRIVLVGADRSGIFTTIFSSAESTWSTPASTSVTKSERLVTGPAAHVGEFLFFLLRGARILSINLSGMEVSIIPRPPNSNFQGRPMVINWEGNCLGFAAVDEDSVNIYTRELNCSSATWLVTRVIDLETLMPATSLMTLPYLVGFASESAVIFVWTAISGLFHLDLKSDKARRGADIGGDEIHSVIPYLGYYIPGVYAVGEKEVLVEKETDVLLEGVNAMFEIAAQLLEKNKTDSIKLID